MTRLYMLIFLLLLVQLDATNGNNKQGKMKKDIRDFSDADIERLYDEWEENDEDELPDDEKPEHLRPKPSIDVEELRKKSNSPDEMLQMSKKGMPVMMFVNVVDPNEATTSRVFTEKLSGLWQTSLHNNHIDLQVFTIEDNRLLFMFKEGSQAWEAREFLLKQRECKEVTLEGKSTPGQGAAKQEL